MDDLVVGIHARDRAGIAARILLPNAWVAGGVIDAPGAGTVVPVIVDHVWIVVLVEQRQMRILTHDHIVEIGRRLVHAYAGVTVSQCRIVFLECEPPIDIHSQQCADRLQAQSIVPIERDRKRDGSKRDEGAVLHPLEGQRVRLIQRRVVVVIRIRSADSETRPAIGAVEGGGLHVCFDRLIGPVDARNKRSCIAGNRGLSIDLGFT